MVVLNNVTKEFKVGKTVTAVNGVDLTINKGEIFAIIGYPVPVNQPWYA